MDSELTRDEVKIDDSTAPGETSEAGEAMSSGGDPVGEESISGFHAKRLVDRRQEWKFNRRLALISVAAVGTVVLLLTGSYFYHSNAVAKTFIARADAAKQEGAREDEMRWLSRYLLVRPNDTDKIIRIADVADLAAEEARPEELVSKTNFARRRLANSIAILQEHPDEQARLRRQLIRRLLQIGGSWYREAERQAILLDAPAEDPFANKSLALAIFGQINLGVYGERMANTFDRREQYWEWLASQPAGLALQKAVETNATDLDVVSAFLTVVRQEPDQFQLAPNLDPSDDQVERAEQEAFAKEITTSVSDIVRRLNESGSARARLIVYLYGIAGSEEEKKAVETMLLSVADASAARLQANNAEAAGDSDGTRGLSPSDLTLGTAMADSYWDYLCVLEASRIVADRARLDRVNGVDLTEANDASKVAARATRWYEVLVDAEVQDVSATMRQNTFLSAGRHAQTVGDIDGSVRIWRAGLGEVNLDNLELLGALTTTLAEKERTAAETEIANQLLEDFDAAIQRKATRLIEVSAAELSAAEQSAIARLIDVSRWRAGVSRAQLMIEKLDQGSARAGGNRADIIRLLEEAFKSPAKVRAEEKVVIATRMAEQYRRMGAWDRAAETLSSATELMPGSSVLHGQAAEAWMRAGNQFKANEHWRMTQSAETLEMRIAAARGSLTYQLDRDPDSRDLSGVRQTTSDLIAEVQAETAKAKTIEEPTSKDATLSRLARSEAMLRILELSIPKPGVSVGDHLRSEEIVQAFADLANDHQEDPLVQAYAAERLVAVGRNEDAKQLLSRLRQLVGETSIQYVLTLARVDAALGKPLQGVDRLIEFAKSNDDPDQILSVISTAAGLANRAGEPERAYEAMQVIPAAMRSPKTLFSLYEQASLVGSESDMRRWTKELVEAEGESGTYWKYIRVSRLVGAMRGEQTQIERTDPRITEAQNLLTEVIASRPRWSIALAMKGWLSALSGRSETAVEELRFAISEGDERLSTRRLLWSELIKLGRFAEADEDIQRTANSSGVDVDPYGQFQISAALRKGDVGSAVAEARAAAESRSEDPIAHLIVAKAASYAAVVGAQNFESADSGAQIKSLVLEAREALATAEALLGETNFATTSTKVGIEIAHGDVESRRLLKEEIVAGNLGDFEKTVLLGQLAQNEGDLDEAIQLFRKADQLRPGLQWKLVLADLFGRTSRRNEAVAVLEKGLQSAPENAELREQLAQAIIARDGENVDWSQLETLLASGRKVNPSNRFLYATMLASRGDSAQDREALRILRELVIENSSRSYAASLTQGALLIRMARAIEDDKALVSTRKAYLDEARSIYERNAQIINPSVEDCSRYALFLLEYSNKKDWPIVDRMLAKLRESDQGMIRALQIEILLRQAKGQDKSIVGWLREWPEEAGEAFPSARVNFQVAAALALIRLEEGDQGVELLSQAYADDEKVIVSYFMALSRLGRHDKAAKLTADHFRVHRDVQSARLLVQALLASPSPRHSIEYGDLLRQAAKTYPRDIALLESVGTWMMQSGRPTDAVVLYKRVLGLVPGRIVTLNNLAMAYTLIPGLAGEGLAAIDRALSMAGNSPVRAELLDTKGTVLLRAKKAKDALVAFEEAIAVSDDPRFQFHKILALLELDKPASANQLWQSLDKDRLDPKGLTANERRVLEQMLDGFDAHSAQVDQTTGSI